MNIHLQQSVNLNSLMKCIHCAVKYFLCLLKYNYKALKLIIFETFCFTVKIVSCLLKLYLIEWNKHGLCICLFLYIDKIK